MATPASKPLIYGTTLTTSPVNLYTVGVGRSGGFVAVRGIKIANTSGADHTVSLYHAPSGGGAASNYAFLGSVLIKANSTIELAYEEDEFSMMAGDEFWASCAAASAVNLFMYGAELIT